MSSKSVNLLLPGLFKSFQKSEFDSGLATRFNLIQRLLSQSNYLTSSSNQIKSLPADYTDTYPLALYENGEELRSDVSVLYADPVNIEVKSDHIVSFPVSIDAKDKHKIKSIIDSFNQHFLQDGLVLKQLLSGRIVCLSTHNTIPEMTSSYAVYGRDMKHFLPQGAESKFWLRVFNEVQMFLHEYVDNENKQFNGRLLNGFWFWGASSETSVELLDDGFIGTPSWLKGFCDLNNVEHASLSDIGTSCKQNFHVIDESLLLAASCGDLTLWLTELNKIESELLFPLLKLLKSGAISHINIHDSSDSCYQLKDIHKYRFYRKNKSLSDICVADR